MRNWVILGILILIVLALAGCETVPKSDPLPVVAPTREVVLPKRELMDPCPALQAFAVKSYTQGETVEQIVAPLIKAYRVCAARQAELSTITAKALNIDLSTKSDTPSK